MLSDGATRLKPVELAGGPDVEGAKTSRQLSEEATPGDESVARGEGQECGAMVAGMEVSANVQADAEAVGGRVDCRELDPQHQPRMSDGLTVVGNGSGQRQGVAGLSRPSQRSQGDADPDCQHAPAASRRAVHDLDTKNRAAANDHRGIHAAFDRRARPAGVLDIELACLEQLPEPGEVALLAVPGGGFTPWYRPRR